MTETARQRAFDLAYRMAMRGGEFNRLADRHAMEYVVDLAPGITYRKLLPVDANPASAALLVREGGAIVTEITDWLLAHPEHIPAQEGE